MGMATRAILPQSSNPMRLVASAAIVLSTLVAAERASACASDSECKGDRICDAGLCVDPRPLTSSSTVDERTTMKTTTVAKTSAPSVLVLTPRVAPAADVPSRPQAEVEPAKSPWHGVRSPVRAAMTLLGGESRRQNDDLFYGTGFGLQLAYITRAGLYVGVHWHEHLENTMTVSALGESYDRIEGSVSGRSSLYLLDFGGDIRLASWLNARLVGGFGWIRATEKISATSSRHGSLGSETRELFGLAFQPKLGLMVRPSAGWYFGPQIGWTIASLDGKFEVGALETLGALGWVL